jgi:hypothetical protein
MLGGLPGSESATPVTAPEGGRVDPPALPDDKLVIELPGGKKKLQARTVRHLMIHIFNTVKAGDSQLFWDEVLCERTRADFSAQGQGPDEAMARMKSRQGDLEALFNAMPMGESTPGLFVVAAGGGAQRLQVTGMAARGLSWTGIDYVMERSNYRLRWFCGPYP